MRIDKRWVAGVSCVFMFCSWSHAAQQTVNARIAQVTVYTDLARVVRSAVVNVPAGDHTVLIENLPTNSDPNSFRVEIPDDNGVSVVNFRQESKDYVERVKRDVSATIQKRDSCIRQKSLLSDHRAAFEAQKALLLSYQQVAQQALGQKIAEGALNTAQWEAAFRFVGQRMIEVGDSLRESERAISDLSGEIAACDDVIGNATEEIRHAGRSIYVDLQAHSPGICTVLVSYLIAGASWNPTYDARLSTDGKLVALTAYALISQHTGEPWDSVDLVLSTSAPSDNVGPGEYRPISLSIADPPVSYRDTRGTRDKFTISSQDAISQEAIRRRPAQTVDSLLYSVAGVQTTSSDDVYVRGGRASDVSFIVDSIPIGDPIGAIGEAGANLSLIPNIPVTFKARRRETVKSGQEPVRTVIGQWNLDAETRILARPSVLDGAYRVVTVTNQNVAPLLNGPVALYTGNEYIGASRLLRLIPQNAKFELPFGRETRVTVERQQSSVTRDRDKSETKVDQTVRFTLKNHTTFTSTIQLEEPLPVPRDNRIKVRLDSDKIVRPQIDSEGKAIWTVTLAPGQTDSLAVPIHISFPSSVRISGL